MPTTANLSLPYPAETDIFDTPVDLQALAQALDVYLTQQAASLPALYTPRRGRRVFRNDGTTYNVAASGASDRLITGFGNNGTSVGNIGYSAGVMTLPALSDGLYLCKTHTVWPGAGAGQYSRTVGFYVNGARPANNEGANQRTVSSGEGSRNYDDSAILDLNAGDQVQVFLSQSWTSSEDVLCSTFSIVQLA